ncbi:Uncharacterized protein dnm_020310 [Desulfonema magnum]|uniref:Uncharacterized protein n=1 Tax=Desulfonema magnum TaxID=45655 RepID=A0A975BIL3_9BACT|nr:Uncharacterized protein dnm_020310 [Desulfonema magnum]
MINCPTLINCPNLDERIKRFSGLNLLSIFSIMKIPQSFTMKI